MLNEWREFLDYTGRVSYVAKTKSDTTYMGRFTFEAFLDFEGLSRVLTILARGYLFHGREGNILLEPRSRIEYARRALCAWCSVPDSKKAAPKEERQFRSEFRELHVEFPDLVNETGGGWFYRHVHAVEQFILQHPDGVRKNMAEKASALRRFDEAWRKKVIQYQIPIFSPDTEGQWTLRFDDVIAEALELGPLRDTEDELPPELTERLKAAQPKGVPLEVLTTLVAYYMVNRQESTDWVPLPVANFDAYFGGKTFSKKYLKDIPAEVIERTYTGYGVSRYRVKRGYLP